MDVGSTDITLFLFLDFVLNIILQQGQRIASVSSHTSHQLQRFNPNWYFLEFGTLVTLFCVHIPLHDAPMSYISNYDI